MVHYNPFSLKGKNILVTGASSGIGRSTAIECSRMGAKLIITGRDFQRLNETLSLLEHSEIEHQSFVADLSIEEDVESLIKSIHKLDGCVFSAGLSSTKILPFYSRTEIERVFDVNYIGPVLLTNHLVKNKLLSKGCSLVYISSIGGVHFFSPGNGIYGASKSALDSFVRFAAIELASKQVRVNSVCPSRVETPLIKSVPISEEEVQLDKSKYLLKRYATPQEIALGCVYLLSDASSFMTGQSLILDGGRLLS
jgi:NAD(P)-dependent dehydrogenase (short-subunit alcohol dehydrogenase family)